MRSVASDVDQTDSRGLLTGKRERERERAREDFENAPDYPISKGPSVSLSCKLATSRGIGRECGHYCTFLPWDK